jgi:hypothetical protein
MRALRIELRRSVAFGLTGLLIALGLANLFWGGLASATGGWATMSYSERGGLLVMWPLAVGAGAWQARREQNAGLSELVTTSPRSPARRLLPVFAALAIGSVLAYLVVLLIGSVLVWRSPADAYLTADGLVAAAIGALSLVTAAWLGLCLGRTVRSAFTAPLAAVLGLALISLLGELDLRVSGPRFSLMLPALDPPPGDHYELPLSLSGQQGLWLTALAVTAFAVTVASGRPRKALALLPTLAAAALTLPFLPVGGAGYTVATVSTVYALDPQAMTPVCTQDAPKVCVMRVHSGLLPEVTGPARKALAALATLPGAPTTVSEVPESGADGNPVPVAAGTLPMTIYLERGGHANNPDELIAMMLDGAGTPICPTSTLNDDQAQRYYVAQEIAGAWATRKAGVTIAESPWPEMFEPGWKTFSALPQDQQRDRVVRFRADALRCDSNELYADLTAAGGPA